MDSDRERLIAGRTGHGPAVHGGRPGGFVQKGETGMQDRPIEETKRKNIQPKGRTGEESGGRAWGVAFIRFGIAITVT